MINAIIVDDEYLVRERLKQCIDWNGLGYEIAGEAANGEDALMILEHTRAQLAIVDINMPIVDGLEFAKTVQNIHPDVKIIILTGYSSFEYAKTALQAGVSDYLLKPINMDELMQVLDKLRRRIEADAHQKHWNAHMQQSMIESDSILRRKFIQSLLDGTALRVDPDKLRLYGPSLREGAMFVIAVSIDKMPAAAYSGSAGISGNKEHPVWKRFAVTNIFNEIFVKRGVGHFEMSYDEESRIVLIISVDAVDRADAELGFVLKTCQEAIRAVSEYLKFTVTAGIGTVAEGIGNLANSYQEALMACKHKTIYSGNRIIRFDALADKTISRDLSYIREDMMIKLRLGNAAAIEEEVRSRLQSAREDKQSLDELVLVLYELVVTLNIYAAENKVDLSRTVGAPFNPSRLVEQLETMEELERWLLEAYRQVLLQANSLKQSTPAKLVEKAKRHIDDYYANAEMDLTEIAGVIFVNPSYLSRIFKSETGYSVVEYLTKCRMARAKELMEQGCKNLYYIAETVGYKDTHYFSKCFKKHYSISPSKFITD